MNYLIINGKNSRENCFFRTVCNCKSTGCNEFDCGKDICKLNSSDICSKYCHGQMCSGVKMEPFGLIV